MQKFWNKAGDDEIYIYGDIVGERYFETDVTAKQFAEDFDKCKKPTLHINSNGGDVFVALAISNIIKNSGKKVKATIDGICASAATLIACAADEVSMAENALYMIHLPSVFLFDLFDKVRLEKVINSLVKVESSLIQTYQKRTGQAETDLQEMLTEETWLTAAEAKDLKFVDAITGAVESEIDDAQKLIILNKVKVRSDYFNKAKEKLKVEDKNFWQKLKDIMTGEEAETDETVTNAVRAQELERIKNLNALRCDNKFIDALIDTAISEGRVVEDVKAFVEALKNVKVENKVLDKIAALIEDNLKSGASEVTGSLEDKKSDKITAEMISKYAKR